ARGKLTGRSPAHGRSARPRGRLGTHRRSGSWLPSAVELRLGKIRAGLAQNLVGLAQLADLALERLDPLAIISGRAGPFALVALGLSHPTGQRLRRAADLGRDRYDRRPLRCVLRAVLNPHPPSPPPHLPTNLTPFPFFT